MTAVSRQKLLILGSRSRPILDLKFNREAMSLALDRERGALLTAAALASAERIRHRHLDRGRLDLSHRELRQAGGTTRTGHKSTLLSDLQGTCRLLKFFEIGVMGGDYV